MTLISLKCPFCHSEDVGKYGTNGSGVRAISRCLGISTDTVIAELKKRSGHKQCQQRILSNSYLVFRIPAANSISLEHNQNLMLLTA
jgi:transposase-like protein